jgi:hypothetical protein
MGIIRGLPFGKIRDFMADEEMGHGCLFLFKVGEAGLMTKPIRCREMDQSLKVARALVISSQWEDCETNERTKLGLGRVAPISITVPA